MNEHILTLARENAPCYLYEYDVMKAQVETLRQTFPQYDCCTPSRPIRSRRWCGRWRRWVWARTPPLPRRCC